MKQKAINAVLIAAMTVTALALLATWPGKSEAAEQTAGGTLYRDDAQDAYEQAKLLAYHACQHALEAEYHLCFQQAAKDLGYPDMPTYWPWEIENAK